MNPDLLIINQLLKIRALELKLRRSLTTGSGIAAELRAHLADLRTRVDVLDHTLDQCAGEQGRHHASAGERVWG
jgi:hypothetical protein